MAINNSTKVSLKTGNKGSTNANLNDAGQISFSVLTGGKRQFELTLGDGNGSVPLKLKPETDLSIDGHTLSLNIDNDPISSVTIPIVQSDWNITNENSDAFIKNKPQIPPGTVTSVGVKMNGASKGTVTTSGTIDLGTVLTGGSQTSTSNADGGSNVYTFSDGSTITVKNGSKGSQGAQGPKGDTGAAGPQGPAGQNATTTATATQNANGLMSAADKTKLDGVAAGAEVNVQSDWNATDTNSDAFIKNKPSIPSIPSYADFYNSDNLVTLTYNNMASIPYCSLSGGGPDNKGMLCVRGAESDTFLMLCNYRDVCFTGGEKIHYSFCIPNWGSSNITGTVKIWTYNASHGNGAVYAGTAHTLSKVSWNYISGDITIPTSGIGDARYFLIGVQKSATTVPIGATMGCWAKVVRSDTTPTSGSNNTITSGGVYSAIVASLNANY